LNMNKAIAKIIRHLVSGDQGWSPLCGLEIADHLDTSASTAAGQARSLAAAFLLCLANGRDAEKARTYLAGMGDDREMGGLACFLERGLTLLDEELERALAEDPGLKDRMAHAVGALEQPDPDAPFRPVWEVFFPEGLAALDEPKISVKRLVQRRKVEVQSANPDPIKDPAKQILFTSNALLTAPMEITDLESLHLSEELKAQIQNWDPGQQRYWYDHPIPLCIAPEANEILHGLKGLSQTLSFERQRRPEWTGSNLSCVCSVSVTHDGLQKLARGYISEILQQAEGLEGLDVYLFTEHDTDRLKEEILLPAAERWFPEAPTTALQEIIGVDGEYGRHYSFLKAVAAWWQAMIDPQIKATFKIDLDQVFPQPELAEQSGASAFEHFMTPLWGAHGIDSQGREVEMGMLAGALVNQKDIHKGIFTPDVPWPSKPPQFDETVFFSALPQAQSTQAEMMTRYGGDGPDGIRHCLQRIHVTGGTNGILLDALRRHRPFTPTFVGRAEDQAYLLSVLFAETPALRYLHEPGLIMRHDKADLIPEAIEASRIGKIIGDYVRIIWYSGYCRTLPWGLGHTKEAIDPFTGCFASNLPMHLVFLRLTLKAASLFAKDEPDAEHQALELLLQGSLRLGDIIETLEADREGLAARLDMERRGWQLFYDIIERIENGIKEGDEMALRLKQASLRLASDCRVLEAKPTKI
jgi:hypothetical protein